MTWKSWYTYLGKNAAGTTIVLSQKEKKNRQTVIFQWIRKLSLITVVKEIKNTAGEFLEIRDVHMLTQCPCYELGHAKNVDGRQHIMLAQTRLVEQSSHDGRSFFPQKPKVSGRCLCMWQYILSSSISLWLTAAGVTVNCFLLLCQMIDMKGSSAHVS